MTPIKITEDDLLSALRDAMTAPGAAEGLTVNDITAAIPYGEDKVRRALRGLQAEGRLEVVRVRRPALDGRLILVPGYRIKAKPKK